MKTDWSLDSLYLGFDSEAFLTDLQLLETKILSYHHFIDMIEEMDPIEVIENMLKQDESIASLYYRLYGFCHLTQTVEAKNEQASLYLNQLRNLQIKHKPSVVTMIRWLQDIDIEPLTSSSLIKEHVFYLERLQLDASRLLSDDMELMLSQLQQTGSTAWSDLHNKVLSEVLVTVNGKDYPLPAVRNLAFHDDQAVRKEAYEKELEGYKDVETIAGAVLNGIKGEVLTTNAWRGYESVLAQTVEQSRMKPETLNVMIDAMVESLPKFHLYLKKKASLLGHENGLPFYDLFAPVGTYKKTYTYEEAQALILEQFSSFSESLASYTKRAFDERWVDVYPKQGKRGGAFCFNLHPLGESRVLTNFDGSFSQTKTLAHELGHAYHGYMMQKETMLNSRYTMPVAETASIFCETILKQNVIKNATKEEAFTILEMDLQGSTQVIVDIYSRFLFETNLFKLRKEKVLSVDDLNQLMIDAQKEAYGEGLDPNYLHPSMWINKPHYYSAGLNFYNFPYAYGLLFARGVYAEYEKNPEGFSERYNALLQATGKHMIEDVASLIGIDVTTKAFWKQSLASIEEDIDLFIELSN